MFIYKLPRVQSKVFPLPASLYFNADQSPSTYLSYNLEHRRLKKIISDHSIDIVISDNRFGLWNKKIKSVYVTHMLRIPFPVPFRFLEPIGSFLTQAVYHKIRFLLYSRSTRDKKSLGEIITWAKAPRECKIHGYSFAFHNIQISLPMALKCQIITLLSFQVLNLRKRC